MPKKHILTTALLAALLIASPAAEAARGPGGVTGVGLGSGTFANGLSLKHLLGDKTAVQANIGTWGSYYRGFGGYGGSLALSVDFLLLQPSLHESSVFSVAWNVGLGAGAGVIDDLDLFAAAGAGIVGLELNLVPVPLDLVVEYRPGVGILPGFGFELVNFTAHLRFYFQ